MSPGLDPLLNAFVSYWSSVALLAIVTGVREELGLMLIIHNNQSFSLCGWILRAQTFYIFILKRLGSPQAPPGNRGNLKTRHLYRRVITVFRQNGVMLNYQNFHFPKGSTLVQVLLRIGGSTVVKEACASQRTETLILVDL